MNKRIKKKHSKYLGYGIYYLKDFDITNNKFIKAFVWANEDEQISFYFDSKRSFYTQLNKFGRYIDKKVDTSKGISSWYSAYSNVRVL